MLSTWSHQKSFISSDAKFKQLLICKVRWAGTGWTLKIRASNNPFSLLHGCLALPQGRTMQFKWKMLQHCFSHWFLNMMKNYMAWLLQLYTSYMHHCFRADQGKTIRSVMNNITWPHVRLCRCFIYTEEDPLTNAEFLNCNQIIDYSANNWLTTSLNCIPLMPSWSLNISTLQNKNKLLCWPNLLLVVELIKQPSFVSSSHELRWYSEIWLAFHCARCWWSLMFIQWLYRKR